MSEDNLDYGSNTNGELLQYITQWEALNAELKEVQDRRAELKKEAKATGYDIKIMGRIIKDRARNPDDVANEEAILETYKADIGME